MKNKSIELSSSQIKAFENGSTMVIFPIDVAIIERESEKVNNLRLPEEEFIKKHSPLQIGDKDVKIRSNKDMINFFQNSYPSVKEIIGILAEIIDVKLVKVGDLDVVDMPDIFKVQCKTCGSGECSRDCESYNFVESFSNNYNTQLKEQNINRTYNDNDYVFLMEFKR